MSEETTKESGGLSRADFLKRSGAAVGGVVLGGVRGAAGVGAAARPRGTRRGVDDQDRLRQPADRPRGRLRRARPYVVSLARTAFAKGLKIGGKTYAVQDHREGLAVGPAPRRRSAQQLINSGVDLMLATSTPETVVPVAAAAEAAGVPCVSTVVPVGGVVARARRQAVGDGSADVGAVQVGLPLQLRRAGLRRRLPRRCGRRSRTTRRSASCSRTTTTATRSAPRSSPVLKGAGYTIVDPGRLPGRDQRLHVADHAVQAAELPDLQHLPDPAGLHDVLAAGGAAGLHEDGQDRADRQDRAVRLAGRRRSARSATTSRAASTGARRGRTSPR